jgi:hypothetical protein
VGYAITVEHVGEALRAGHAAIVSKHVGCRSI